MTLSGIQREVLSLYRQCLRESRKKGIAVSQTLRTHESIETLKVHTFTNKLFDEDKTSFRDFCKVNKVSTGREIHKLMICLQDGVREEH